MPQSSMRSHSFSPLQNIFLGLPVTTDKKYNSNSRLVMIIKYNYIIIIIIIPGINVNFITKKC